MDAIDEIEKRDIDLSIKYDLDEFKKVHAHFVDILSRMHAGDAIDAYIILGLGKKQRDLINDINHIDKVVDSLTNTTTKGDDGICQRIIPILLQLQSKQEDIRNILENRLENKKKNCDPIDELKAFGVEEEPNTVNSAVLDDREIIKQFVTQNVEMGLSETMPSIKFEVVLPGEFFLEKFLLVRLIKIKSPFGKLCCAGKHTGEYHSGHPIATGFSKECDSTDTGEG